MKATLHALAAVAALGFLFFTLLNADTGVLYGQPGPALALGLIGLGLCPHARRQPTSGQ